MPKFSRRYIGFLGEHKQDLKDILIWRSCRYFLKVTAPKWLRFRRRSWYLLYRKSARSSTRGRLLLGGKRERFEGDITNSLTFNSAMQVRIPSSGRFHGVLTVSVKLLEQGNYTSGRTAPAFPPTYNPMNYQFPCGNNQQPYPPPSPMPYPPPYPPECPTQPPHSPYPQTYDPSAWHF